LVGARLPPVELRRRPESVICPPLRPAEARGVGAMLLCLLLLVSAAAVRRATASNLTPPRLIEELPDMVVASAGGSVHGAAYACGRRRGEVWEGIAARGRSVHDPHRPPRPLYITVNVSRMRAPESRMEADGPIRCLFSAEKGLRPANRLGWRDAGRDTGPLELL
jgi:hypothetical protein